MSYRRMVSVAAVALFAVCGTLWLQASHAATPAVSVQAESGTASASVDVLADTGASGNSAIRFQPSVAAPLYFGTLATAGSRAAAESAAGVKAAMLELSWQSYEPADGQFSASYASNMKSEFDKQRAAGMQVTLSLGLHFSPGWVKALPDSQYVDQNGNTSSELNVVFNQKVRDKVQAYLDQINRDFGLQNFWAIRLNSGGDAEMLYPGGKTYFAYDANAQNGPDMPPTMSRNPLPGWKPGDTSVTTAQVKSFADWYIKGLDNVTDWQMSYLTALGFKGYFQTLTPGSGVRPDTYTSNVNNYLPASYLGVGAAWDKYYQFLPNRNHVVVYVSSVADNSGNNSLCAAADAGKALTDPSLDGWSSARWETRIAKEYGLPVAGENPGYGLPPSLESFYTDTSSAGMMATAIRLANTCGFQAFYWAHDYRLYDGTVQFSDYQNYIAQLHGSTAPIPRLP